MRRRYQWVRLSFIMSLSIVIGNIVTTLGHGMGS